MAGIYNRDNIGAQLPAGLEAALARHQATTDRNNARTASSIEAIARGAEGIAKDLHRDELLDELKALRAEREALDEDEEFERKFGGDAANEFERKFGGDAANEFAKAIAPKLGMQRLEDEWVDKHYSDMLRKNKLMGV